MNFHINVHDKKICAILSVFMASALIFAPLVMSNNAFAQSFYFNKISQESNTAKCASGALPTSACKNVDNLGQANSGNIATGQTAGGGTATGGSGSGAGATGGSNTANSAISQSQQNAQSCTSGNLKVLPHSSLSCSNTANLGQANSGNIATGQTAGGGTAKP
jgi:hypothetical protein